MNGGVFSVAITFLPGVGSLLFAWARSADPLVHEEKNTNNAGLRLEVHRLGA